MAKRDPKLNIPVYFFTELLAVALGAGTKEVGMNKHFFPAEATVEKAMSAKPVGAAAEKVQSKAGGETA